MFLSRENTSLGALKFFPRVEPGAPSLRCLEPSYYFTVEHEALKTFAVEPVAPNIKIWTFLDTDSVITGFACCLLRIGTKIVKKKKQYTTLRLNIWFSCLSSSNVLCTCLARRYICKSGIQSQIKTKLLSWTRFWFFLIFLLKLPPAHSDSPSSPTSAINALSVGVIVSSSSNANGIVFSYHSS